MSNDATANLQEAWDNWCLKAHLERSAAYSDSFKREEAARKDREQLQARNAAKRLVNRTGRTGF